MASYRLTFELPGLPRMANIQSGKSHWRHADRERKQWQEAVMLAVSGKKPRKPLTRARLTLIRFSSVEPDFDGLTRGFKSVVDGLVKAGILADDRISNTGPWDCRWEKAKRNQGRIRITVEEELAVNPAPGPVAPGIDVRPGRSDSDSLESRSSS